MQVVYPIREGPFRLVRSIFGHCPNSNWTPPPHSTGHFIYIYHQDHLHSAMQMKNLLLLVLIASAMIQVFVLFWCICVCAHFCNDPGPGLGGV